MIFLAIFPPWIGRTARRKALLLSLFWLVLPCATRIEAQPVQTSLPLLTRAPELRELTLEQARQGYPARLRGMVTFYDPAASSLFIQDGEAGALVSCEGSLFDVKPGQLVEVEGVSQAGPFSPIVVKPRLQVLGTAALPPPVRATLHQLAGGQRENLWIEVRAVVRSVSLLTNRLELTVGESGFKTKLWLPRSAGQAAPTNLVDARVRIRGVSGVRLDERKPWRGFHLFVPSLDQVIVEQAAPADPFSAPVHSLAQLFPPPLQTVDDHRVKIQGVVLFQRPGELFFLRDSGGSLLVRTDQAISLRPGDKVEAAGFPVTGNFPPELHESLVRVMGAGEPPAPRVLEAQDALNPDYQAELIRVEGRLLDRTVRPGEQVLVLQARNLIFPARLNVSTNSALFGHVREGSVLRVTGVCVQESVEDKRPEVFMLLLRSPQDVQVLKGPAWWTRPQTRVALGALTLLSLAALAWVILLRRQVQAQTQVIQQRFEAEAAWQAQYHELFENASDMVYTHDLEGRLLSLNKAGENILGYSRTEVLGVNGFDLLVPEHREFSRTMLQRKLEQGGETTYVLEFKAKDGRRVPMEVSTRMIRKEGRMIGVHGVARDITARQRAEEARQRLSAELENQRRRLNDILASVPGVVWEAWGRPDAATQRIDFVSDYVESMLGYSIQEWLASPNFWLTIVHPEDKERAARRAAEIFVSGQGGTNQFRWIAKNGRVVWVEAEAVVICDADGQPAGMRGVTIDITERKKNEIRSAAFATLGDRLSSARTPQQAAQIIIDVADGLLGWDSCYLHLYQTDRRLLIPVVNFDIVDGQRVPVASAYLDMTPSRMDLAVMQEGKKLILRDGSTSGSPDLIRFGDKSRPSASLMFVPIRNGADILGIISIQSYKVQAYDEADLETLQTLADHCAGALERIRAEEALRESENRFGKAFRATPASIAISSLADGRMLDVNDGFLRMFGFDRDAVIGRTALELGLWANPQDRGQIIRLLETERSVRDFESRLRTRAGEIRDVLISGEIIDLGNEPCSLLITLDLTDRLRLESQLRQSQKMEAVGQLAAGIAHDFNNIMTIIQGHVSLLRHSPGCTGETVESLDKVLAATGRATQLTRQLLAFSRKQMMQPRVIDLNDALSQALTMLQRVLGEYISLQFQAAAGLPAIFADGGMIEQIILNLALNARDAMPEGGQLTIATAAIELDESSTRSSPPARPGRFVCLKVADTGCGMDAATLSRIFEPFFTTKDVGKGTGLGLSMVYGMMSQHQGWIDVRSEVGRGTAFTLFFPAESKPPETFPLEEPFATSLGGSETILVVEDESAVRNLVRVSLARRGYRVLEARSGREALQVWQAHRGEVALLVTDMVMPEGVSGVELAEQLQSEDPRLRVLFTSGYSQDFSRGKVELVDGVNFLPKPYLPSKLAQMVRNCLDAAKP